MANDDDEVALEGILKSILVNHRDNEVTGLLVFVFEGGECSVYNSNIKAEIVEQINEVMAVQH